jgi:hypothetical protein
VRGACRKKHDFSIDSAEFEVEIKTSISRRDRVDAIEKEFHIWYDKRDIKPGEYWSDKVEAEVEKSDAIILLLSPAF